MPPCAQTECERLTGTIENKSTLPPLSAILMTAESPASPPPTTMIFGFAIDVLFVDDRLRILDLIRAPSFHTFLFGRTEFRHAGQTDAAQQHKQGHAHV